MFFGNVSNISGTIKHMTPATMFIAQPVHPTMNDQLNFEVCRKLSVGTPDLPVNIANASKLNRAKIKRFSF